MILSVIFDCNLIQMPQYFVYSRHNVLMSNTQALNAVV